MKNVVIKECRNGWTLGKLFVESFRESVQFYFPNREQAQVESIAGPAFQLLLEGGCTAFLASERGNPLGYAIAACGKSFLASILAPTNLRRTLTLLRTMAGIIRPDELLRLAYSRCLFNLHLKSSRPHMRPAGHLVSIAVHPEARERGLGRMLLRHTLGYFRQLHMPIVLLECRQENIPARKMYESEGFQVCGHTKDLMGSWLQMLKWMSATGNDVP